MRLPRCCLLFCLVVIGCARSEPDMSAVAAPSANALAPIAASSTAPPGTSPPPNALEGREEPRPAQPRVQPACPSSVRVEPGESFEGISRRCYGSRTYQDFLMAHNHHERKALRAGETLTIPPFETLARAQVSAKWQGDMRAVAESYSYFLSVQPEVEKQLRAQKPGMGQYRPSTAAKLALDAAAKTLRPVVERFRAAGVRTQKFAQALEAFERLASGAGSFSTDYAIEDIHQCFSYGISALR
jgi:hypothetical protein